MIYKTFAIFVLSMLSAVSGADFFSYFGDFTSALYTESKFVHTQYAVSNGWDRICGVYSGLHDFRMKAETDTKKLSGEIETVIKDLNKNSIIRLSPYEKDFLTASLYGSLAYLKSDKPSLSMLRDLRKSLDLFSRLEKKYDTTDSSFGTALSEIALSVYFENSFWVRSVLRRQGDILKGIRELDNIVMNGGFAKTEAALFLTEYYSLILNDGNSSKIYTEILNKQYPGSRYFAFLYAKDLYHSGKIREALRLFRKINGSLGDRFYPFDYESVIYEVKCLFIMGDNDSATAVLEYAEIIHDGYMISLLRNEWRYSVSLRQDVIFGIHHRFATMSERMSEDEIFRTAEVLFDHGFFREVLMLISRQSRDIRLLHIELRSNVNLGNWEESKRLMTKLERSKNISTHSEKGRLELIRNIIDSNLRIRSRY